MTIEEMIKKYHISDNGDGTIKIMVQGKLTEAQSLEIKNAKPAILEYLHAQEEKRIERQQKIDAIEGLKEIERAIDAEDEYHYLFEKMMDDESNDGVNPPKKPKTSSAELMKKYPRAANYIRAERMWTASNYAKSAAGAKALERIINGEDGEQALSDAQAEWSAHCNEHIWD